MRIFRSEKTNPFSKKQIPNYPMQKPDQRIQTPKQKNEITKCRCKSQIPKSKTNFKIPDRKKPDVEIETQNCSNA